MSCVIRTFENKGNAINIHTHDVQKIIEFMYYEVIFNQRLKDIFSSKWHRWKRGSEVESTSI